MNTLIDQIHKIGNMENTLSRNTSRSINGMSSVSDYSGLGIKDGDNEWQDLYYDGRADYCDECNISVDMRLDEELEWEEMCRDKEMGFIAEERELMWYKKEECIRVGKKFVI